MFDDIQDSIDYQEHDHTLLVETLCELQSNNLQAKHEIQRQSKIILEHEEELKTLRLKYSESKNALLSQVEATCRRENEQKELEMKWKKFVERERSEYVNKNEKLMEQSKQLEDLRRQIQNEIDQKYKDKIESMDNEIQEQQTKRFQIKREFELYKVQQEIELESAVRNALNSNQNRITDESQMRNELAKFIENDSVITGELNKLKADLKESELLIGQAQTVEKALKSELDCARMENQKLKNDGLHLESQYEMKIQEQVDAIAALNSKYEMKCNDVKRLSQELSECKDLLKNRHDKIQGSEQELRKLKTILVDKEKEVAHIRFEMKEENQRSSSKIKNLVMVYQKEKDAILRQKHDLQLRLEEVERELYNSRNDFIKQKEESKRNFSTSLNDAIMKASVYEQRVLDLESALAVERNQSKIMKLQHERLNQTDQYEREVSSNECNSLQHSVKSKDDTIHHLEEELMKLRDSTISKDQEYTRVKEKLDETEDQVQNMRNTISSLSEDAKFSKMEAETLKKQLNNLVEKSMKEERRWKQRLDCEMKRSKGYKERCLEAHAREKLQKWNSLQENESLIDPSF